MQQADERKPLDRLFGQDAIEFFNLEVSQQAQAIDHLMKMSIRGHRAPTIINAQSALSLSIMSLLIEDYANKTATTSDELFATGFSGDATSKRNIRKREIVTAFERVAEIPLKSLDKIVIQNFCYLLIFEGLQIPSLPKLFSKFSLDDIQILMGELQTVYRKVNESLLDCDCFQKGSDSENTPKSVFDKNMMDVEGELHTARKAKPGSDDEATVDDAYRSPAP